MSGLQGLLGSEVGVSAPRCILPQVGVSAPGASCPRPRVFLILPACVSFSFSWKLFLPGQCRTHGSWSLKSVRLCLWM